MRLQNRDIEIINYIETNKGATIKQIGKLFFKNSYESAKKRLKILQENKQIKGTIHYILNKKVYYMNKLPSYHRLIANEVKITLLQSVKVIDFKLETKINKYKVDALCVYKKSKVEILIIEIDIYNRTTDKKIETVINEINCKTGVAPKFMIISLHERRLMAATKGIINIKLKDINTIVNYI